MEQILHQILSNASTVILPHFGAIIKLGESYQFNEFLKYNDGKLIAAVETAKGVSTEEATAIVSDYIRSIKEALHADKDFNIGVIGIFSKKAEKVIIKKGTSAETSAQTVPTKTTEKKAHNKPAPSTTSVEPKKEVKDTPPVKKETPKVELSKTTTKKAEPKLTSEELPKAYTSTNLVVDKAIEKINTLTTAQEITAFVKGEKREQVLTVATEKKKALTAPKVTAPITPKTEKKAEVPPVKSEKPKTVPPTTTSTPKEEPKESKPVTPVTATKTPKEESKTPVTKAEPKEKKASKAEPTTTATAPAPTTKNDAKDDEIKEALKAGAIVIEKEVKKRKRNRLILWVAILLLLIGSSIIGYLKKNELLALINKTELAEHKDSAHPEHGDDHSEEQYATANSEQEHSEANAHDNEHQETTQHEDEHNAAAVTETDAEETSEAHEDAVVEETPEEIVEEEVSVEEEEETIEEEPEVIEEVKPVAKGKYNIVVGSFSEENNANKLVEKLNTEGYSNAKVLGKYGGLHAVSIDNFESRSDAKSALSDIKSKGYSGWIKKI